MKAKTTMTQTRARKRLRPRGGRSAALTAALLLLVACGGGKRDALAERAYARAALGDAAGAAADYARALGDDPADVLPGVQALLAALDEYLQPGETLLLRGRAAEMGPWQARLNRGYAPRRLGLTIPADADGLPKALADRRPRSGPVAYLCSGASCAPPIETLAALETALGAGEAPPPT